MTFQFVFDPNHCTGCHACQVACDLEYNSSPGRSLRNVHTFNENHHPDRPVFSLSLACNHCEGAPCMKHCPALAYRRDSLTGAVLLIQDTCIGCRYCTWACPFDAPKFDEEMGIIQKCTFCHEMLASGENPRCVQACPVNALNVEEKQDVRETSLPGITDWSIKPALRVVLPRHAGYEEMALISHPNRMNGIPGNSPAASHKKGITTTCPQQGKISPIEEWPLLIFTLTVPILVAWLALDLGQTQTIPVTWFMGVGVVASGLSALHLGRKRRAYRAIFNLRHSWLSREIAGFAIFFILGSISLFLGLNTLKMIAVLIGIFTLYAIDRVYDITIRKFPTILHSSSALINGFYFASIGLYRPIYLIPLLALKTGLIWSRIHANHTLYPKWKEVLKLFGPILVIGALGVQTISFVSMVIGIGILEILDRHDFYNEIDVITPKSHMQSILNNPENG